MKEIGENLQRIRDFKSIKQKDAAELLGVTPQYLSEIERGMHDISVGTLGKFGEIYQVNPGVFFGSNAQYAFNSFQQQGGHSNNYILPSAAQPLEESHVQVFKAQTEELRKQVEHLMSIIKAQA